MESVTSQSLPPDVNSQGARSLEDVHSSVPVKYPGLLRRLFAFSGPAYMVSVGYMDPGNWATDIEGGAKFGYTLLWVLVMSNGMAVLLQTLSARLGIVTGRDLAQACRDHYSRPITTVLWILCEVAIVACDLAEVIGTLIGLKLLFGLPLIYGLILTAFDTFLFLAIQKAGIRKMEAFIIVLVSTIGACFVLEIIIASPAWGPVFGGLFPRFSGSAPFVFPSMAALTVAIGIIGATVMPHNLYLHSALVQSRQITPTTAGVKQACRYNLIDSVLALNAAFFVNAAILIMAAATFHHLPAEQIADIQLEDAYKLLGLLGAAAPKAFAIALLCAGQSSTMTGTLAGQIVMEGFVHLRIRPWLRRLITRLLAILPAMVIILLREESKMMDLLVASQVVLGLQLPFAIVPLLQFTGSKRTMGQFASPAWVKVLGWMAAAIIIGLDVYMIVDQLNDWMTAAGAYAIWVQLTAIPFTIACGLLLGYILVTPWLFKARQQDAEGATATATALEVTAGLNAPLYKRIGVALDHKRSDAVTLKHAVALARAHSAELVLIHVVDGVGGQVFGDQTADRERREDQVYLDQVAESLRKIGVAAQATLVFGKPSEQLTRAVTDQKIDFLVLGSHGHGYVGDKMFGETVGAVRHAVKIPVLAVREKS